MGLPTNIYAYTAPGADFPQFVSVNARDGAVEFSVRSPMRMGGNTACAELSAGQALDMARAIIDRYSPAKPVEKPAPKIIKPTVGRMVNFYREGIGQKFSGRQPMAAQIAYVHSDHLINIGYLDHDGAAYRAESVPLLQVVDDYPDYGRPFCEWMDFQKGQAAKTEAAEAATLTLGAAARRAGPSSY